MILCPKCGKVKTYKVRQTDTREVIYGESGCMYDLKYVKERKSTPKCPKCGRKVKFFKDIEETEDERELDGNEMRDLVEFLTTLNKEPILDKIRDEVIAKYPKNYAGEPELTSDACEFSLN